jgi:hypothetical protein
MKYQELEEAITRLDSVDAARVVSAAGTITEVHVIAATDKPAKQVVRDVQSLAMARFGTSIDRRVISVVQITPDRLDISDTVRPALVDVTEEAEGTRTSLKVTLRRGDDEHTGSATGPAVASTRLRLIAEAAIDALGRAYPGLPPIAIDTISSASLGTRTVVVAILVAVADGGSEHLTVGSALARDDEGKAAVRAVLNALNRQLTRLEG